MSHSTAQTSLITRNQRISYPRYPISWELPSATAMSWKHLLQLCFFTRSSNFAILSSSPRVAVLKTERLLFLAPLSIKNLFRPFTYEGQIKGFSRCPLSDLNSIWHLLGFKWLSVWFCFFCVLESTNFITPVENLYLACFHETRQAIISGFKTCLHIHVAQRVCVQSIN